MADRTIAAGSLADVTIACRAPYGQGGLGRHALELAEFLDGQPSGVVVLTTGAPDGGPVEVHPTPLAARLSRTRLVRWSPAARQRVICTAFDRRIEARLSQPGALPADPVRFVGFGGQALRSLRRARTIGFSEVGLLAANSHVDQVRRQHALARQRHPIERSWLGRAERRQTIAEYDEADVIYVASAYTARSFMERGYEAEQLVTVPFRADPRFVPPHRPPRRDRFEVVYTGSLAVVKGTPLLIEAIEALPYPDLRLTLVGGPYTRSMRRHLDQRQAADHRIVVAPGDPLPHLQRAHLYVHPSYEDGLAYAPLEALACGVAVVVTDDTGMKERLPDDGRHAVVPTGDLDALVSAIDTAYRAAT